jgi:hypothetical protein
MATTLPILDSAPVAAPTPVTRRTAADGPSPAIRDIDAVTAARWGPRWSPSAIVSAIEQYALECGWVEGTVYSWAISQTIADDDVFHSALDVCAATLLRAKNILIHSPKMSDEDSLAIAAQIKNVETAMGFLLHEFELTRPLETPIMAWNIGVGMERHYALHHAFNDAIRKKISGEGLEAAEVSFVNLDKAFDHTIEVFKGPPGSTRPEIPTDKPEEEKSEMEIAAEAALKARGT